MCRTQLARLLVLCLCVCMAACAEEANTSPNYALDLDIIADQFAADMTVQDALTSDILMPQDASVETDRALEPCVPVVPEAATRKPGEAEDGGYITVTGRRIGQYGRTRSIEGFPSNLLKHPTLSILYLTSTSHDDRDLHVIDSDTLEVLQTVNPPDIYAGMAFNAADNQLLVSGGDSASIVVFDIDENGRLTNQSLLQAEGYVSFIAYDAETRSVWYTRWDEPIIQAIDLDNQNIIHSIELAEFGWQMYQMQRTLMVTSMVGETLVMLNLDDHTELNLLALTGAAASLCAIGEQVYLAMSNTDQLARISMNQMDAIETRSIAEDLRSPNGNALANSNVNAVVCDPIANRIYASRGADNMISIFDAVTLDQIGLIPTGKYPNEIALDTMMQEIWVAEGQGGTGPSNGRTAKSVISGAVRRIDLSNLDLSETTAVAEGNYLRPKTIFPFECDGFFPVPTKPTQASPIEHIVLIVKENKTFDCVFGDLDPQNADVDPSLTLFGREITPNLHALADQFALSDNFYTEVEDSDIGHILLTATHLTEYVQRIWIEKDHARQLAEGYQVTQPAIPKVGNFFTHLMENDVSLKIMGEVVGINAYADGNLGQVGQHIDLRFPGGSFVNYTVKDEEKARRLVSMIDAQELKAFTYILLPNDHTLGTRIGAPTPESMVSDNDYAVGLIIEALSHSPYWMKSAAIILQDDPQGCRDHVDVHRSPLLVVSPWARRGYVSHTRASFLAVFNTMERILGIPPIGRGDASAAPLWDMFSAAADPTPFDAIPRQVEDTINTADSVGASLSAKLDFRGPDRNPALGPLLEIYMAHRAGQISKEEAEQSLLRMEMSLDRWLKTMEESVEERFSFDAGIEAYHQYLNTKALEGIRYPSNAFNLGPN